MLLALWMTGWSKPEENFSYKRRSRRKKIEDKKIKIN